MATGLLIGVAGSILLLSDLVGDDEQATRPASSDATVAATGSVTPDSTPAPSVATPPADETTAPTITPTPTATPLPPITDADIASFLEALQAAVVNADANLLIERLHPAVFDRYGEAACSSYFGSTPPELELEVLELFEPAPWNWTTDDLTIRIDDALEVEVARIVAGQTFVQRIHLATVDGQLAWFTDCGEPVASE